MYLFCIVQLFSFKVFNLILTQSFRKNLICTHPAAYQGMRNVSLAENYAYIPKEWSLLVLMMIITPPVYFHYCMFLGFIFSAQSNSKSVEIRAQTTVTDLGFIQHKCTYFGCNDPLLPAFVHSLGKYSQQKQLLLFLDPRSEKVLWNSLCP